MQECQIAVKRRSVTIFLFGVNQGSRISDGGRNRKGYYNFIGEFDLPLTAEEIAQAKANAERKTEEAQRRKRERQKERSAAFHAKAKAERWAANEGHKFPKRVCEYCGKEFWPNGNKQRFCTKECTAAYQQAEKQRKRYAEKGDHTFRQKNCILCGKPFWPVNGQEVLCSEECKAENRRRRQLEYYHRKKSEREAGNLA